MRGSCRVVSSVATCGGPSLAACEGSSGALRSALDVPALARLIEQISDQRAVKQLGMSNSCQRLEPRAARGNDGPCAHETKINGTRPNLDSRVNLGLQRQPRVRANRKPSPSVEPDGGPR